MDKGHTVPLATSRMLGKKKKEKKRRVLFNRDQLLMRHLSEPPLFPRLGGFATDSLDNKNTSRVSQMEKPMRNYPGAQEPRMIATSERECRRMIV